MGVFNFVPAGDLFYGENVFKNERFEESLPASRAFLLGLCFFVPLLGTLSYTSVQVNTMAAFLQLAFVFSMVPETRREIRAAFAGDRLFLCVAVIVICTCMVWLLQDPTVFSNARTYVYLSAPLFYMAMVGWLRYEADENIQLVYRLKLSAVVFTLVWISIFLHLPHLADLKAMVKSDPPIYRHLRHLNYDLALIIPLAVYFFCVRKKRTDIPYYVLFVLLGYFTVWSGGRGQWLSLVVFCLLVAASRPSTSRLRQLFVPAACFILGAALVFVLGETQVVSNTVSRTLGSQSIDMLSEGRIKIWVYLVQQLIEHDRLWFGMGPEGVLALKGDWGIYIQAHNFIVQWLVEFGLVGTAALLLLVGRISWQCLVLVIKAKDFSLATAVSALFLSMLCFALVDGIYYHGLPLTMMLIMAGYVRVVCHGQSAPNVGVGVEASYARST